MDFTEKGLSVISGLLEYALQALYNGTLAFSRRSRTARAAEYSSLQLAMVYLFDRRV